MRFSRARALFKANHPIVPCALKVNILNRGVEKQERSNSQPYSCSVFLIFASFRVVDFIFFNRSTIIFFYRH